jgi:hypothetical protein
VLSSTLKESVDLRSSGSERNRRPVQASPCSRNNPQACATRRCSFLVCLGSSRTLQGVQVVHCATLAVRDVTSFLCLSVQNCSGISERTGQDG